MITVLILCDLWALNLLTIKKVFKAIYVVVALEKSTVLTFMLMLVCTLWVF